MGREIEDYGIIGNLQTTALVSKKDASIDFFCFPFCDSPSVFARLLDEKRGGHFSINPAESDPNTTPHSFNTKQLYLPSSNVLQTRFSLPDGIMQVTDLMPVYQDHQVVIKPWLVRKVDIVRGCLSVQVSCKPAFKYGLDAHESLISPENGTIRFKSPHFVLKLTQHHSKNRKFCGWNEDTEDGDVTEGLLTFDQLQEIISKTNSYWNDWISKSAYKGRWREIVNRSALVLKMLTFHETGAIIASPTFSLPEEIGGSLNWDYRFTWIRDAAFTVYGFLRIGLKEEAEAFMEWIQRKCNRLNESGEELHILYDVHGETIKFDLLSLDENSEKSSDQPKCNEVILNHLNGYEGSRPVRIGNAAAKQNQIDIYGELMDAIYLCDKYCKPVSFDFWKVKECFKHNLMPSAKIIKKTIIAPVLRNWRNPDHGIWEIRGQPRHYVYSKVMCWVCLDRAIRLAIKHSLPAPLNEWRAERDSIQEQVMERGWNSELGCFVQSYDSLELDAANLIMPLVFFIAPSDNRFISTLKATAKALSSGGLTVNNLTFRYNPYSLQADKEMQGNDGTFCMCTFWLAEALCLAGKYDEECLKRSISMFEDMIGYANHLGLFSEEISLSGRSVGNFPQALTHLSLISAAFNINRVLESIK